MIATAEKSLYEVFAELPDPRDTRGRRHALAACLTLCAASMLCGCRSLFAIAQWGRDHDELAETLGFKRKRRRWPCVSTLHYLFKAVDVAAFEAALTAWMLAQGAADLQERVLNIDGKTLRGSQGDLVPGVHLVAAYAEYLGTALTQLQVDSKTNEHKAALELLKLVPLKDTLITGDAAFAQKDLCQAIVAGGGDYFFTVKDNQPTLKQNILDAFDAPVSPSGESRTLRECAHGGQPGQARRSRGNPQDRDVGRAAAVC
jgi:hypothetical protein